MLYGGSIAAGRCVRHDGQFSGRALTIQDVYEALGAYNAGLISAAELKDVEDHACPGPGACGGQFTANTMATACEMLGISAMGWNGIPAAAGEKGEAALACGRLAVDLVNQGVTPRALATQRSFENAIAGVMATGGSTNAVLHLLAMAHDFGVQLSLDDFDRISRQTPVLADLRPWGTYTAPEMHAAGGMAVVGKRLIEAGLLHAEERTVTGHTLGDMIARAIEPPGQVVVRPLNRPLKPQGGIAILYRESRAPADASSSCLARASRFMSGRHGCLNGRRTLSQPSRTGAYSQTTSWCCATRVRKVGRGCERCSL